MSQLPAHYNQNGHGAAAPAHPVGASAATSPAMTLHEVWQMAEHVSDSKLFAATTPQAAFTLMMLAQAEGLHPIQAMRRYHIIEGRPSMRSDAMQAEFQARGGKIKILKSDATEARAVFSHPEHQPDGFEMAVTFEQFKATGSIMGKYGVKDNWKHSAADMLWARLVTKAIRRIYPGIVAGIYSSDEVQDMIDRDRPEARQIEARVAAEEAVAASQVPVMGYHGTGYDAREFRFVVADGVAELNDRVKAAWVAAFGSDKGAPKTFLVPDAHRHLINRAVQAGRIADLPAAKPDQFAAMKALYASDQGWVRTAVQEYLEREMYKVVALIEERQEAQAHQEAPAPAAVTAPPSEDNEDPDDVEMPGF